MRVQSRVLDAVEQDLKKAGFPPLAWYDALLELSRRRPARCARWNWKADADPAIFHSRLIDRLVDEGLAARARMQDRQARPVRGDHRAGRELQKKMRGAYSAAIEKHVGSKLSDADAMKLCGLLDRLGCPAPTSPRPLPATACRRDDGPDMFR